ncbi:hypothetical protein [Paenarthrobacter sp. PH39-S1]|uniref:hypothetical protein n=1 Tax=Paenarthrobacter sp. PH39-S1 TaxID=3046204 RepID=UPI0024BABFDE|nr:hypothetical protein [Paenarthrobacter sp. PH39-S1]MDJ0357569.1 hypothetical protein [Paenarthrobacter sp. PH39-S1]
MSARPDAYGAALERARVHALEWLASVPTRPVGPRASADDLMAGFAAELPEQPTNPGAVIDEMAAFGGAGADGDLHSVSFDPFGEAVSVAHARGAWVHVGGAAVPWPRRHVLRISVSNWSTDGDAIAQSLAAVQRAAKQR